MAIVKKTTKKPAVKKAQTGAQLTPTYKNLRMGVQNQRSQGLGYTKTDVKPTKEDSAFYRFGFNRGVRGEKEYPGEPAVQKMGRWEGQNAAKAAKSAPKSKDGSKVSLKAKAVVKKSAPKKIVKSIKNKK